MNGFYNTPQSPPKTRLPAWFWIISVLGLVLAVLAGYFSGNNFGNMAKLLSIEDTNGEDTAICSLDFKGFLGVYDGYSGYNRFDSDVTYIMYDTSRDYNVHNETYDNSFAGAYTDQTATFLYLNYYDVCFVYELNGPKTVTAEFSSKLEKGNMEGRLLHVAADFKVELDEFDVPIVKDEYITSLASFGANDTFEQTLTVPDSGTLIFVVACEGALGSYHLKIS